MSGVGGEAGVVGGVVPVAVLGGGVVGADVAGTVPDVEAFGTDVAGAVLGAEVFRTSVVSVGELDDESKLLFAFDASALALLADARLAANRGFTSPGGVRSRLNISPLSDEKDRLGGVWDRCEGADVDRWRKMFE